MDPAVLRDDMVDSLEHEAKAVVRSDAVGIAMREVPRHCFVDDERNAHADCSHVQAGTHVLAPSTVARLLEPLHAREGDCTLVVGAGVGYTSAVLAEIVGETNVHAVDITRHIVHVARENLARAGYDGVLVDHRDGAMGLAEYAPFDRILVETAAVEPPRALVDQLAHDGRLVMPLGLGVQTLVTVGSDGVRERHGTVSLEPMLVEGEQPGAIERNRTEREDREFAARAAERRRGWEHTWIDWDGY